MDFLQGADRQQTMLFPKCLDDWVDESNPVRAVDVSQTLTAAVRAADIAGPATCTAAVACAGRRTANDVA